MRPPPAPHVVHHSDLMEQLLKINLGIKNGKVRRKKDKKKKSEIMKFFITSAIIFRKSEYDN